MTTDINLYGTSIDTNFLDDRLAMFVQELDVLFNLDTDDVYGHPQTLNLRKYVLTKSISNAEIMSDIKQYVFDNSASAIYFRWDITVEIIKSEKTPFDVLHIIFNIYKDGKTYKTQYLVNMNKG